MLDQGLFTFNPVLKEINECFENVSEIEFWPEEPEKKVVPIDVLLIAHADQ